MKIWRDDDVWYKTTGEKLDQFLRVDDHFQKYQVPHTLAVLAAHLDENQPLVDAIKERRMLVQLHAWHHDDLSVSSEARLDLVDAIKMLERLFGARPTVLYPPWNRTSVELDAAAKVLGLQVRCHKISLQQYIRFEGDTFEDTVNFHFWDESEFDLIPKALAIYRKLNPL
jgi:peptidoglycan/xylan/chitin deacetylase (PgdA/CDA1 family)